VSDPLTPAFSDTAVSWLWCWMGPAFALLRFAGHRRLRGNKTPFVASRHFPQRGKILMF
jgi:hypothetical protein